MSNAFGERFWAKAAALTPLIEPEEVTEAVSSCSCGRARFEARFADRASLRKRLDLARLPLLGGPDMLFRKLECVAERIIPGELPRCVRPAEDSVSSDDWEDKEIVDFGLPDVYVRDRAPAPRLPGDSPNSEGLSEKAPSDCGGLLRMLVADSEFLLGLETLLVGCAAALAASFSATSSATVLGGPSAISASDVAEVMLESRFRPHSSHPTSADDLSMSKLPLSLFAASMARIAGLAGELGLDEFAYSLPGGGDVGGTAVFA